MKRATTVTIAFAIAQIGACPAQTRPAPLYGRRQWMETRRRFVITIATCLGLLLIAFCPVRGAIVTADELEKGFAQPPDSAKPWVYWFWLDGNVTKEGITADLEAMRRVGLGGALWMWGGGVSKPDAAVRGPVEFLDAQWWILMRHAIREADRLGLKLNLTVGSGWSHSGGPWITPDHSMQKLVVTESIRLTGPDERVITVSDKGSLVAVLAYRLKDDAQKDRPNTNPASREAPANEVLDSRTLVDLTPLANASERLNWPVPAGTWLLQILHHRSTGDEPHPKLTGERGLECDKLSPEAVEANWNGFIRRVLDECGPEARRVIRYVHADSYEFQPQTWTPRFREEFKRRCGYDPLPFLPAVVGRKMDSDDTTARFLWDFRRIRADLFAENIGGRLRDLCRREGISLTTEPHLIPEVFDQIQYGGHVSEPVGNFLAERRTHWYADNPPVGPEVHLAKAEASSACTYGLNGVVWAEAFTGVDHAHPWKETPEYLRTWGDLWLTEGINRFAFHCWAHSPPLDRKPGITLGPWGIHFDRRNTWFEMATGYLSCLTRCQYLLQQGLPVVDVCVLTGDGVTAEFPRHPMLRANGYDYHGLTTPVLMQATVDDGRITLPSGMQYRLLVTYSREMTPPTLRKLRDLVGAGATVLGIRPDDAPGLVGYPASRDQVRALANELWGSDAEAGRKGLPHGKGRVFWGEPEKPVQGTSGCGVAAYLECGREIETLLAAGISPDFQYPMSGREDGDNMLAYAHRRLSGVDWYFLSNQADRSRREQVTFRLAGRQPELWDPVTGERRELPLFTESERRTTIPLEFEAGQSYFVVFRESAAPATSRPAHGNFAALKTLAEVRGPWEVSFDPRWGGPDRPIVFQSLCDWASVSDEAVRFYSGQATYRNAFDRPVVEEDARLFLDLGDARDLAEVRLNGTTVGLVWCRPRRIEITNQVRAGRNDLEITVVNQWVNRLVGDSGLSPEQRVTWTTWNPYKRDAALLPSGLLGPVTICSVVGDVPL